MPSCRVLLSLYCIVIVSLNEINGDGDIHSVSMTCAWSTPKMKCPWDCTGRITGKDLSQNKD